MSYHLDRVPLNGGGGGGEDSLGAGAIVGIVIGSIVFVLIVGGVGFLLCKGGKKSKEGQLLINYHWS